MAEKINENDKFLYIKKCLAEGETRGDIAQKLGYRNWRSLDMLMRRKGMKWDSRRQKYYSTDDEYYNSSDEYSKIQTIISMFDNKAVDPKNVALQTGFRDHHEMAAYMKSNGYIWSHNISNYIRNTTENDSITEVNPDCCDTMAGADFQADCHGETDISRYLPLLDLLLKNIETLKNMFSESVPTIPRYAVSGSIRTKSFYMSDKVSRLISEYSHNNNISQKEIVEAAIIEFLCKYSYKDKVCKILDSSSTL